MCSSMSQDTMKHIYSTVLQGYAITRGHDTPNLNDEVPQHVNPVDKYAADAESKRCLQEAVFKESVLNDGTKHHRLQKSNKSRTTGQLQKNG